MELNPIRTEANRKEIQCSDCGHLYFIAHGQKSSRCARCGNIEFFSENAQPLQDLAATQLPIELLRNKVLEKAKNLSALKKNSVSIEEFNKQADGKRVEEILCAYQIEWQLWAVLVKNFHDPNFHAAYLSHIIMKRNFDTAAERYRAHRSIMALLKDEVWQAEVSDLMLTRIESISLVGMQQEGRGWQFPSFLYRLQSDGRATKLFLAIFFSYILLKLLFR